MISKPKLTINKFTGMSGDGGIYYLDGFSVEKENGTTSLDENYLVSEKVNTSTTNYSNLGTIMAMLYIYPLSGSTISAPNGYTLMMNSVSKFFHYNLFASGYQGEIGGVSSSGTYLFSQKPDMAMMPSGNILYTSSAHMGLMVRGLCKTGSGTEKIIDTDGRNFTTLGLSATAPNNKVTNLKTGAQYTITSISTTTATNDTLNFSAGTANAENDEFIGFVNTKFDLLSGITVPQFKGQSYSVYWARPIKQYGDTWYIANGNYLAKLAADESTFENNFKQLPSGYQCIALEVNGSDILISAVDNSGRSHILRWDGFSDGWLTDVLIGRAPSSLKAYGTGWVYLADSSIYYTDGRNIQKLIEHPDNKNLGTKLNPQSHNGIAILNDIMYFAASGASTNRSYPGVLVFNRKTGLSYFKVKQNGKDFTTPICIYIYPFTQLASIYGTSNDIEIGCGNSYCNLNEFQASSDSTEYKSFVYYLDLGQETQIHQIALNINKSSKVYASSGKKTEITVSIGNGNSGLIQYGQIGTIPTTTTVTNPNGVNYPFSVGDEIEFTDGDVSGQRTFVTNVTDGGTSSEVATVSPALSTTSISSANLRIWKVKKAETKVINDTDISKPVIFNTNFIGSNAYIEVTVRGTTDSFPVSIRDIIIS